MNQDNSNNEQPTNRLKKSRTVKRSNDAVPAFLLKTYEILENPQYEDIISWNDDGNAFIVKRVNDFTEQILPKYFKHQNFASFVRQLNMYDFHKTRNENNENEFKHKLFLRDWKHLLPQIKRKSSDVAPIQQLAVKPPIDCKYMEFNDLVSEMAALANKQSELEKLIKVLIKQNEKFQKDNRALLSELIKIKSKSEQQSERIMMWFLSMFNQKQRKTTQAKTVNLNNSILMLKDEDEQSQAQEVNAILDLFKNLLQKIMNHNNNNEDDSAMESSFEGISKRQIMQGLISALSMQSSSKKVIQNILLNSQIKKDENDDDNSDDEEPFIQTKKVKKVKTENIVEPEQQMMLYQNNRGQKYQYQQYGFPKQRRPEVKQEITLPEPELPPPVFQNQMDEFAFPDIYNQEQMLGRRDSISYMNEQEHW